MFFFYINYSGKEYLHVLPALKGSEGSIFQADGSIICGKQGCSNLHKFTHHHIYQRTDFKKSMRKKYKAKDTTEIKWRTEKRI